MICEITRGDIEINVQVADPKQYRNQCVPRKVRANGRSEERLFWKIGAHISDPKAYCLVRQGVAIPVDDECKERAAMTTEGMQAASYAYERLSRGIDAEDFAAYDAGYLTGYEPDGSWKPGPNGGRAEYEALFEDEDEGEDDDE